MILNWEKNQFFLKYFFLDTHFIINKLNINLLLNLNALHFLDLC